jgi:hypothetical protein
MWKFSYIGFFCRTKQKIGIEWIPIRLKMEAKYKNNKCLGVTNQPFNQPFFIHLIKAIAQN